MPYSLVQYTGNGATNFYSVPFPFLERADVTVTVNGVTVPFSWISDGQVLLAAVPAYGALITIARSTSRGSARVDFQNSTILTEASLDTAYLHSLYVAQEAFDNSDLSQVTSDVSANAAIAGNAMIAAGTYAGQSAASATAAAGSAAAAATSAAAAAASAASFDPTARLARNINETYDLNGGGLAATVSVQDMPNSPIPAGHVMSMFSVRPQGDLAMSNASSAFAGFDFSLFANFTSASSEVNGCIGAIYPKGTGIAKAIYGRVDLSWYNNFPDGVGVALVAGINSILYANTAVGLQISTSGPGAKGALGTGFNNSTAIWAQGDNVNRWGHGLLFDSSFMLEGNILYWVKHSTSEPGNFFRMIQPDGTVVVNMDSYGNLVMGPTITLASQGRILGDFSNSNPLLRTNLQSTTTNGNTVVGAIPNGTNQTARFTAYNASDPTNASAAQLSALAAEIRLAASIQGTGTYLPLNIFTNNLQRMQFPVAGGFVMGTGALATTVTDGFPYVPTCAGTPTGTPTAYTGRAPLIVDDAGNKVWVYIGGAWKYAALT
jgi:hypothetical protein